MIYAADLAAQRTAFAARADVSPDELVAYLDAHAQFLANTAHMPAPFDDLLALDAVLDASSYPAGFRYANLFCMPVALGVTLAGDAPLVGAIAAEVVAAAAVHTRSDRPLDASDEWEVRALEELLANAAAAAALGFGLVGVYA